MGMSCINKKDSYVIPVDASKIDSVWLVVKPMLQNVLEVSKMINLYGIEDIYVALCDRQMQLWVAITQEKEIITACTTKLVNYPKAKVCQVGLVACKDPVEAPVNLPWGELIKRIESWAREVEFCDYIYVDGRIGWKRVLKDSGYEFDAAILIKDLIR